MSHEPIAVAIERLHLLGVADELIATLHRGVEAEDSRQGEAGVKPAALSPIKDGRVPAPSASVGVWTIEAVRRLGMTTDVPTAAQILGIGRTLAFHLVRTDEFPVRIMRIGRRIVVPVPELLRALGVSTESAPQP